MKINKNIRRFFTLKTPINTESFSSKNIIEIIENDSKHLDWIILNMPDIMITEDALGYITQEYPNIILSSDAIQNYRNRLLNIFCEETEDEDEDEDDYEDSGEDTGGDFEGNEDYYSRHEEESFGKYAGSYAQDTEGLSDDFIDDVLDGDPDAYWNID